MRAEQGLLSTTFVPTAIPALQPIVHDLFVLRGTNKADAGRELETQKEVVVSMLLRLIQYHQVRRALSSCRPGRSRHGPTVHKQGCRFGSAWALGTAGEGPVFIAELPRGEASCPLADGHTSATLPSMVQALLPKMRIPQKQFIDTVDPKNDLKKSQI